MAVYGGAIRSRSKPDASPVTDADERAERVILAGLRARSPHAVVAEEEASRRIPAVPGEERFWLVDPLDGTREFLQRNDEFTVNVALVGRGRPLLGVIVAPALGLCFRGIVGEVAERREGEGTWQPIRSRQPPRSGLAVLASRSHLDQATRDYISRLPVARLERAGSSLKFCRLAEGLADLYPRFGRTMEWDTAAGHAILLAAGGHVTTPEGTELAYGKPGFVNGPFIASGTSKDGYAPDTTIAGSGGSA
ncbi:MAG: 3'(2'),5'-bisphosphate nucleotidase CysQ [Alphaproteobacteria bacterium]|nr:3'(2'),5'-bisphosphate nucleotidase CysQ [Alphaproteobacteria bacterium]